MFFMPVIFARGRERVPGSIGHPPIFHTASPTFLALAWGVIATWWVGMPFSAALAIAARAGSKPKLNARLLFRPMALLFLAMALCAVAAGLAGAILARGGSLHGGSVVEAR
jgi:hypothetical protein